MCRNASPPVPLDLAGRRPYAPRAGRRLGIVGSGAGHDDNGNSSTSQRQANGSGASNQNNTAQNNTAQNNTAQIDGSGLAAIGQKNDCGV
ncbi:hypothetical protein [Streptomyces sp. DSM 40750]|uniref:hypothetical protein n=1 Tax=Streptomyces sp. DSM 40750 TaxID=2801030 RepID=UPI00214CE566|nr:hypothetical protein [Streptomyces sp. DSM 40750]UUU23371.1 hypothetical protein JIX55_25595 [Streptomyces sp. DSM 40750]